MKKTRTTAGARKDAAPKVPRSPGKAKNAKTQAPAAPNTIPSTASGTASGTASDDAADAMESITTGMKKIKINLITQSQREARERARLEAEKAALQAGSSQQGAAPSGQQPLAGPIGTPGILPAVVGAAELGSAEPVAWAPPPPASSPPASSSGLQTPAEEACPSVAVTPDPRQSVLPESSPDVPQVAVQPVVDGGSCFIPYQPEGPVPVAVAQQGPLKWLPQNVSTPAANTLAATPSPAKRQDKLFHYTSGIPFAPRPGSDSPQPPGVPESTAPEHKTENHEAASVWDVPETPQK